VLYPGLRILADNCHAYSADMFDQLVKRWLEHYFELEACAVHFLPANKLNAGERVKENNMSFQI